MPRLALFGARIAAGVAALVLAGCGGGSPGSASDTVGMPPAGVGSLTSGSDTVLVPPGAAGDTAAVASDAATSSTPREVAELPAGETPVTAPVTAGRSQGAAVSPAPQRGATAPAGSPSAATVDTVRGRIAVVGAAPMTRVVVTTTGGRQTQITGALAAEIGGAAGAELVVRGRRDGETIAADSYAVRSVDGVAAMDGELVAEGERLFLSTSGRRVELVNPPAALREHVGGRVWISGSPAQIVAFGVLSHHHH